MNNVRILLADDHEPTLERIRRLLEPEFEIVGAVGDGETLLCSARDLTPDVVVVDVSMPGMSGIEAARRLRQDLPSVKVVFLSNHSEWAVVSAALAAGACGYVVKLWAAEELAPAIHDALGERCFVSPCAVDRMAASAPRFEIDIPEKKASKTS